MAKKETKLQTKHSI